MIMVNARGSGVFGLAGTTSSALGLNRFSGLESKNWVVLSEQAVAISQGYSGYTT